MTASPHGSILPAPTTDEARHTDAVERFIRERIVQAGGWISFETFMELALYAPGLGYYSAGSTKLGRAGDFVTAPELSDLFSRCVAQQCAEILATAGGSILELGAGSGRMAATILESLAASNVLPDRYDILEVSADLRDRQRETVNRLPESLRQRVKWLDRLPANPVKGVVLANEVLDALPCHRFVVRDQAVRALGVSIGEDGRLVEREAAADAALSTACTQLQRDLPEPLPDGYRSEVCLRVAPWIAALVDRLDQGVMLLFDYGLPRSHYYHPQRSEGTLLCHFKHRAHTNSLINVGIQDITAWVDFTRVAESAIDANLDVLGFTTQAAFLLGTGIDRLAPPDASSSVQARWASEARQLLLPGEMGEAFKVMALGRAYDAPLRGFAIQDLRRAL